MNLQRTWKLDSAASLFILNLKSGKLGHLLVDFTIFSMVSIIFSGQIFGSALMTIAIDWNSLLGELGVDALRHFGVL